MVLMQKNNPLKCRRIWSDAMVWKFRLSNCCERKELLGTKEVIVSDV